MMREMKDSGNEWLTEIPSSWEIARIGSLYSLRNTKVSDTVYQPLSVTNKGVLPQLETVAKTNAHDDRKLVKKGDFAINSRSDRRGSCGISSYDGSVSLINTVLAPLGEMNPKYYDWLFHTIQFADEFYKWGHGIVDDLWTTSWQEMKKIQIPFPPLPEQRQIADFLDAKCAEIDALCADIQAEIDTLEEYKRSVITETVTKGLDPNVPMKDSGIPWIGEIPKTWMISRIKHIANIYGRIGFRGYTQNDFVEEGEGAITLSPSNFKDMKMNYEKCSYLTWAKYYESPEIMIKNGDVLFVKTGSTYGKSCFVSDLPMEATINPQLIVFKNIKGSSLWFSYFLQTPYIKNLTELAVAGGTIPTMSQEKIANFYIILPPTDVQHKIASYLRSKCEEIDSAVTDKTELLLVMDSVKKSLIYEYVTGKKEVPNE